MEDLDVDSTKLTDGALRILERAEEEALRRHHTWLLGEHLFMAFAQVEWPLYSRVMRDLRLNPEQLLELVERSLGDLTGQGGRIVRVPPPTQAVLRGALQQAIRGGRDVVESFDLFAAILEDPRGGVTLALREIGTDPVALVDRLITIVTEVELRDDRLRKRFELPPFLRQFATNLNLLARQDKLAPVFGRERELRQLIEVLCHRERASSAMLVGEPGVGKTAVVEALASRIEFDPASVPPQLRDCQILNLPMNSLVAGTMLRGMFEDRMQNVLREAREHPHYLLFIDEAHTMIGAGSALGAPSDAANIFKSALARGEVRVIGATTLGEYKQHIAEDDALARRFRTITVVEPSREEARAMLIRLKPRLQQNYSVVVLDEAIDMALLLSTRYQRHLRLPDKAIGWLDTAAVRAQLAGRHDVCAQDMVDVVAEDARIPVDLVAREVSERFREFESTLHRSIVGQTEAVRALGRRLVLNKGPLKDGFDRPDGVLLFLGPTGVGKTQVAKALAGFLFGDEKRLIRIDMSEFQDGGASVDKLIGSPRGIVGSERGGALTNQLRDTPYSVVLLDEVEKASPSLLNVFLQAFDEGWITDGRGRRVYLSDAVVIMTSNVGAEHFRKLTTPLGFRGGEGTLDSVRADVSRELERRFSPEFRNRIDEVVIFQPLTTEDVRQLVDQQVRTVAATLAASGKHLSVSDDALELLAREGYSVEFGARFLKRVIDDRVKIPLSQLWTRADAFRVKTVDATVVVEPWPVHACNAQVALG